jgi:condensin complex subunit 2
LGGRKSLGLKASLDNEQVTALYSQCIQLSTNNKIDSKNAWSLKLIDYIEDVLKQDDTPDQETNFQKARYTHTHVS